MTGYAWKAIVHHGVLEPGVSFLQKPITPQALTSKLREVIESKAGAARFQLSDIPQGQADAASGTFMVKDGAKQRLSGQR